MPKLLTRPGSHPLRSLLRTAQSHWKLILAIASLLLVEAYVHVHKYDVPRPSPPLDAPFYTGCQHPVLNTTARESAVFMMLARNSEVKGAVSSVRSVQEQFNDNFGYPWVFLNDEEWTEDFKRKVGKAVGEGADVKFEVIPKEMWGYPEWIDQDRAKESMQDMKNRGIQYGGLESYHHMCRFQSGFFYDHPALLPYKYYWRVEPSISFTCAITYDPFVEMARHKKRYGYTTALWERGQTVPSLFRKLSLYKNEYRLPTSTLWTAMIDASWMPWPFRRMLAALRNRDERGDLWNMCHFWSNFEIADMDFFRGDAYRAVFDYLDRDGGFYYERWGDAPVHSLAAAMLLQPQELHHFSDWGYIHDGLQVCTFASTEHEKAKGIKIPRYEDSDGDGRKELGCRCKCDDKARLVEPVCLNRIGLTTG